jgi:toxin ParE1/3/4
VGKVIIVIAETAYADLEDIENYIAQDSPIMARKFILHIFDRIDQLYAYPLSGKPVPEIIDQTIRELLLNKYRIIYRVSENEINIIGIVHDARLLDIEI